MIRFECLCGKRLKVDDMFAGQSVQCPYCGITTAAPEARPAPANGPQALQVAMREVKRPADDDIPVAEVVAEPAPSRPAAARSAPRGEAVPVLDALAQAARPASTAKPARKAGRPPKRASAARQPNRLAQRAPAPNGKKPPAANHHTRNAAIIGVAAAVGIILIFLVVASLIGTSNVPPPSKPPPSQPARHVTVDEPEPRRFTGHQPGEMFKAVPFDDEVDKNKAKEEEEGAGSP